MTPKLTAQTAQVTTATVEIQTLTISGKQVTLAVFRQLPEERLIASDGTLNGVPWGTVNYHPDRCGEADDHWHVAWQQGNKLLRAHVDAVPKPWEYCTRYWNMRPAEREALRRHAPSVLTPEENELRTRLLEARNPLRNLPQLFIAV